MTTAVEIVTSETTKAGAWIAEMRCGAVGASIMVSDFGVRVVQTTNSNHRTFGGMGRAFVSLVAAMSAYKSAAMRAMLAVAAAEGGAR